MGLGETLALQLVHQHIEGALDDSRKITARVRVAHQVAGELELVLELGAGVELEAVAVFAERFDPGWRWCRRRRGGSLGAGGW